MGKQAESLSCFSEGFNCAQSVLAVYSTQFGLDRESALKVAGAFGGGIAGRGETCGAVTGGLMVIGLAHASIKGADPDAKERTRGMARRFLEQFESSTGSCKCRDLLNCDIGTPEGREQALTKNLFKTACPTFISRAIEILDRML